MKEFLFEQRSPEWLYQRRFCTGASEAPAMFDKSPYFTYRDLWFDKMGIVSLDTDPDNWAIQKGQQLEPLINRAVQDTLKLDLKPRTFIKDKIFMASLDGYEDHERKILEAKYVGKKVLEAAEKKGIIPEHHNIQMQQQMFVMDTDQAYWAGTDGRDVAIVKVKRKDKLIAELVPKVQEFWESIRQNKVPPLGLKDTLFIHEEMAVNMAKRAVELGEELAKVKAEYDLYINKLKALADHPRVQIQDVSILEVRKKGNIDYKKIPIIKRLKPETLDKYRGKDQINKQVRIKKHE